MNPTDVQLLTERLHKIETEVATIRHDLDAINQQNPNVPAPPPLWHGMKTDKALLQKQMQQLMTDMQIAGGSIGVEALQQQIRQESQLLDNEMSRGLIEMRDE